MNEQDDAIQAPQRMRVRKMAAKGLPAETIRLLTAPHMPYEQFKQVFAGEIAFGGAEADLAVAEALYKLASTGKSIQATLAWAKQRLGWRAENEALPHDHHNADTADSAAGWLGLQALMDEFAARKAGLSQPAPEMDTDGTRQSVAAAS